VVSLSGRLLETVLTKSRNFEWVFSTDTSVTDYTKIYDQQSASVRKFLTMLPPSGNDSQNVVFFHALCDTFNNFRYISSNSMFYNESNLANVLSGDHLLKRRLPEIWFGKIYQDILNNNKIFYYFVNVQDKRYGEHTMKYRVHNGYERNLIAIPNKNSYIYFMPRVGGVKYHLNELPFYFEGTMAALTPSNFQEDTKHRMLKVFKLIKTHSGTYNENTRTENASVKINLDSLQARFTIKESLSGQFSTILRHLYLGELIDSTIARFYFKSCVDKPGMKHSKVKLSSHITEFPFRYNFNCNADIAFKDTFNLNISNWFSFPISKASLPVKPELDYYFDFDFSDSYNFLLEFNQRVNISNADLFGKKINNEFFELDSEIKRNSETAYMLKVKLIVKQKSIPFQKAGLLMQLVSELDQINNFKLNLVKVNEK
jgi:hypothetical protein